ncbi:unnamed protein product [Diplocarpon coronariae]
MAGEWARAALRSRIHCIEPMNRGERSHAGPPLAVLRCDSAWPASRVASVSISHVASEGERGSMKHEVAALGSGSFVWRWLASRGQAPESRRMGWDGMEWPWQCEQ